MCLMSYFFFGQSGEVYWWGVSYQQGLPRLVFDDYGYDGATQDILVLVLLASVLSSVPTLAGPGLGVGLRLLFSKPSRSTTVGSHHHDEAGAGKLENVLGSLWFELTALQYG